MQVSAEAVSVSTVRTAWNVQITVPGNPTLGVLTVMTVRGIMKKGLIIGERNVPGIRSRKHMRSGCEDALKA